MSDLNPLDDPRTVTGVMQSSVHAAHAHESFAPRPPPTEPHEVVGRSDTSGLMTGDPVNDQVIKAVTAIFSLRDDQVRANQAGKKADDDEKKEHRKKTIATWITIATIVFGGGGGGGAWYLQSKGKAEVSNEEAIRRHDVDGRLTTQEIKGDLLKVQVDGIGTDLVNHTKEQAKENQASKLSSVRQEMMLEELLRARGRTPPVKTAAQINAERAIGINPDNPLGNP